MERRLVLLGSECLSKSAAVTNHSALPAKNAKERVENWGWEGSQKATF